MILMSWFARLAEFPEGGWSKMEQFLWKQRLWEGWEWCKREKKGEKREGERKKDYVTFCFYIGIFELNSDLISNLFSKIQVAVVSQLSYLIWFCII